MAITQRIAAWKAMEKSRRSGRQKSRACADRPDWRLELL